MASTFGGWQRVAGRAILGPFQRMRDHSMGIRVRYFASLRERLGRSQDTLESEGGVTVSEAWERLWPQHPLPPNTLVAVNHEYASLDRPLGDGDEVAFFPPVTGG